MILNWSQEGFWRLQIELGTIEAIPLIGSQLRDILTGGGAVSTVTVEHLYTIHSYILSVGAIVLAVIHLGGLLLQEWEAKHLQRDLAEILSVSEVSEPQKSVVTRSSGR
jgi:cytochrome b6